MYWAVSPARLQMWLFLELKFPAEAVSIVSVVVSHRLAFSYDLFLLHRTFSHNISHSSNEAYIQ